jgi:hypothetical protein
MDALCSRKSRRSVAVALSLLVAGAGALAPTASARATRVKIDARTTLVVPSGAMPRGAFIYASRLDDIEARATPGLVGPPFKLRLAGASRLHRAARLVFRYPNGVRPRHIRFGTWRGPKRGWQKVRAHVDRRHHSAWIHTRLRRAPGSRSAQAAGIVDWGMGVFAEFGQFWGEVLQHRVNRPNCSNLSPGWVESVTFANDAREPLFSCGMHDPNNGAVAEVRIANNRSYGMWVSFEGATPDWAWLDLPGVFSSDLKRWLNAKTRMIPGHADDVFLPPTTEAHIGFRDPGRDFSIKTRPSLELIVASGAMSVLSSRLIGLRGKLLLTPLFTCEATAGTFVTTKSPKQLAGAILDCARKSIDAIAAHKMAFLDTATPAWLGIKSKALAEIAAAMAIVDFAYQTSDLIEVLLESSWRTTTVKHAFVPRPVQPGVTPVSPTPTPGPGAPWGGGSAPSPPAPPAPPPPRTWSEQESPNHPVNTFTNYHNASGMGPAIAAGQWVQVSCKVYDPTIRSVNPDGYWYRIASPPWSNAYYSPANTFMNGDPYGGPYTHNTDFAVPNC